MKTLEGAFRRMGELAMLSLDKTKSDDDRELYNAEFTQLQSFVLETAGKKFNGVPLFSDTPLDVTINEDGGTFTMPKIDVENTAAYSNAYDGISIDTAALAATAITKVNLAISQVATDRASLGAAQARLNFTRDQLSVAKENLSSAVSRIQDLDMAEEATQYAKYQILVQSGTSMLTQANTLPQAALQLLR